MSIGFTPSKKKRSRSYDAAYGAASGSFVPLPMKQPPLFSPLARIAIIFSCSAGVAYGQTPPSAGTLYNEQQRLQQQQLPDRLPTIEKAETIRPTLKKDAQDSTVRIKHIHFSGATHLISEDELQEIVRDALGSELNFAGLEALAQRITDELKRRGYLLARAYLPRQDITEGDLEIAILAGRLESKGEPVKIVPGGKLALRIDPKRLEAIVSAQLKPGETLHDNDLQRAVLLMNDLPGISARSRLEAGEDADSTRIVVDVEQAPMLTLTTSLDNYGNRYTGENRLVASLLADELLGIGDRVAIAATLSDGSEKAQSEQAQFNYSMPIGNDGLRFGVAASVLRSHTGKEFAALDLSSESETFGVNLSYPFIRSRNRNLWGSLAADSRKYTDESRGTTINLRETQPITLGLSGDQLDGLGGGGFTQAGLSYIDGQLEIKLPAVSAGDAATAKAQGHYTKWVWNIARLQRLTDTWTLQISASGQIAGKNLDTSEKFALGGPFGVRAYPGSDANGDSGSLASAEVRYDIPSPSGLGQWQLTGFADHGHITLHKDPWPGSVNNITNSNTYDLNDIGFGINLNKPGSYSFRFALATRLGSNPGRSLTGKDSDGLSNSTRAWLQALIWL